MLTSKAAVAPTGQFCLLPSVYLGKYVLVVRSMRVVRVHLVACEEDDKLLSKHCTMSDI